MRLLVLLSVIGIAWTTAADNEPQPIVISFSGTTIHAAGITTGGETVIFASTIGIYSGLQMIGRHAEVVRDTDGDGAVTMEVSALPATSVWAVVDLSSGRYAVATPPGFTATAIELPTHGWKKDATFMDFERDYLEVLLVRPGVGAWTLRGADGGANDGDGILNKNLRTTLEHMQRLYGDDPTPHPAKVQVKDLLILIDPHQLDYFVKEAK